MIRKEIWDRAIELAEKELLEVKKDNEEILYVPVLVKTNERGEMAGVKGGDYTNPYYRELSQIIIKEDIEKYSK
ncbi:MAG: hypothetical protein ACRC1T_05715 [Clostridium chrysemydis]|uniref:hypothetical protein n=1 Tax=Clostridium chrysemydis TaxID=2665504 RepID=UPI003F368CA9